MTVLAAPAKPDAKDVRLAAQRGKAAVIESLKDPESARFRQTFVSRSRPLGPDKVVLLTLCGEVNAKNSMGGYGGFKRFHAGATTAKFDDEGDDSTFQATWESWCSDKVQPIN